MSPFVILYIIFLFVIYEYTKIKEHYTLVEGQDSIEMDETKWYDVKNWKNTFNLYLNGLSLFWTDDSSQKIQFGFIKHKTNNHILKDKHTYKIIFRKVGDNNSFPYILGRSGTNLLFENDNRRLGKDYHTSQAYTWSVVNGTESGSYGILGVRDSWSSTRNLDSIISTNHENASKGYDIHMNWDYRPVNIKLIKTSDSINSEHIKKIKKTLTIPFKPNDGDVSYGSLQPPEPYAQYTTSNTKKCEGILDCSNVMAITGVKEGSYDGGVNFHDYRFQGVDVLSHYTPGDAKYKYRDVHLDSSSSKILRNKCNDDEIVTGFTGGEGHSHQYHCMKPEITLENGQTLLKLTKQQDSEVVDNKFRLYNDGKYYHCPRKNQLFSGFANSNTLYDNNDLIVDNTTVSTPICSSYKETGPVVDQYNKAHEHKNTIINNNCILNPKKAECSTAVPYMRKLCALQPVDNNDVVPFEIKQHWLNGKGWLTSNGFCNDVFLTDDCEDYGVVGECSKSAIEKIKTKCKVFTDLRGSYDDSDVCNQLAIDAKIQSCKSAQVCTDTEDCMLKCSDATLQDKRDQDLQNSLNQAKNDKAAANALAAEQSAEMLKIASAALNPSGSSTTPQSPNPNTNEEQNKETDNTMLYVLGGGVLISAALIAI